MNFAKGPWSYAEGKVGPVYLEDDQSFGMVCPVAWIEKYEGQSYYNHEANAHLIKSAPDLFSSLKKAIKHMCNQCGSCELDDKDKPLFESETCNLYREHLAVLRKALGEE